VGPRRRPPGEEGAPRAAGAPGAGWSVWRRDDHGHEFEVRRGLPRGEAEALAGTLEARGHKQTYWTAPTVGRGGTGGAPAGPGPG
jgi:hypothetical protein